MSDNGARPLAVVICSTFDMTHHDHEAFLQPDHCEAGLQDAAAILANGAAFLPDAAELDRLRDAVGRVLAAYHGGQLDGEAMRDMGMTFDTLYPTYWSDRRAALAPEGSAGTAPKYGHILPLPEGVDPLTDRGYRRIEAHNETIYQAMERDAAEGSARDGG